MTKMISVLLPTRNRPTQLARLLESFEENTLKKNQYEIIVYIDENDKTNYEFLKNSQNIILMVDKERSMGGYNSACLGKSRGEIVILLNDDVIVRTKNWDEKVRDVYKQFPDGVFLAYPNDLYKGNKIPTFPILSKYTCETMQNPFPEEYSGSLIDYHVFDVFKRLKKKGYDRICYLPELIFEHMHFRAGKAAKDDTYNRRGRFMDDATFLSLSELRAQQAEGLYCAIADIPFHLETRLSADYNSKNVLQTGLVLFRRLVLSSELPLRWRLYLFSWFFARKLAAMGYLAMFGIKRDHKHNEILDFQSNNRNFL